MLEVVEFCSMSNTGTILPFLVIPSFSCGSFQSFVTISNALKLLRLSKEHVKKVKGLENKSGNRLLKNGKETWLAFD